MPTHLISNDASDVLNTPGSIVTRDSGGYIVGNIRGNLAASLIRSPSDIPYALTVSDAGALTATSLARASDLFDRADSASVLGGPWTVVAGTWGISSNAAYCPSGLNGDLATVVPTGDHNNVVKARVKGTIISNTDYSRPGLVIRGVDNTNFLLVRMEAGSFNLLKNVAGTFTTLYSATLANADDTYVDIKVVNSGNNITLYKNGTLVTTYTLTGGDATQFGTAKNVGMRVNQQGAPATTLRFDKIIVEPILMDN